MDVLSHNLCIQIPNMRGEDGVLPTTLWYEMVMLAGTGPAHYTDAVSGAPTRPAITQTRSVHDTDVVVMTEMA